MDREKIIKGLNDIGSFIAGRVGFEQARNFLRTIDDALSLLKEQETKEGHWIVLEFCANEGIYCSECHMKIFDRITKPKDKLSKYCPHCGSRNEQFFRDGEVVFR